MVDQWTLVRIGIWWFPFNLLWTALLTQGMQVRTEHLAPPDFKGEYLAVLTAAGAILSLLSQLVAGPLSDRHTGRWGRRRPFIALGVLCSLPFLFGFAWLSDFALVVLCFAGVQWFLNFGAPSCRALLPDLVPPERHGVASAQIGIWSLIGQILGMVGTGLLLSHKFWQWLGVSLTKQQAEAAGGQWLIVFVTMLLLLITALVLTLPDRPAETSPLSLWETIARAYRISLRDHADFAWLIASRFFINLGFYTAVPFLRWFLADSLQVADPAIATTTIGLLVTFASLLSLWVGGKLADKISKRTLCIASAAIAGVGGLIFVVAQSFVATLFPAVLFGIGSGIFGVANWALAVSLMPKHEGGKFFALFQLAITFPQVFCGVWGGLVGGAVNRALGEGVGWRVVFVLCIALMFLGTMLLLKVREPKTLQSRL